MGIMSLTKLCCRKFAFTLNIAVCIRNVFKEVLSNELGCHWSQLAAAMGLARTYIDNIQLQADISLLCKISTFLGEHQFPAFRCDEETSEFLVEALERACLPNIASAVRRELKYALQQEGTQFSVYNCMYLYVLSIYSKSVHMSCFSVPWQTVEQRSTTPLAR